MKIVPFSQLNELNVTLDKSTPYLNNFWFSKCEWYSFSLYFFILLSSSGSWFGTLYSKSFATNQVNEVVGDVLSRSKFGISTQLVTTLNLLHHSYQDSNTN